LNKTIPVIILNWNGLNDTIRSVESIFNQSHQDFHIFLADNDSGNKEGDLLKKMYGSNEKVTVVLNKKNLGFAKAHNQIFIEYILDDPKYEFVALLNNDAFADSAWLENLYKRAKDRNVGMVASKMINYFNRSVMDNSGHMLLNTSEVLPIGFGDKIEKYDKAKKNFGACAGAVLYNVAMLRRIGIYDKNFNTGYEDAELGLRANLFGYETWYEPTAIVFHKISQSLNKVKNFNYLVYIQKSIYYSFYKLMPKSILITNTPIIIIKYILVMIFNVFTGRWKFIKLIIISA